MAKTKFKSVEAYIAAKPEAAQKVLESVRNVIRRAVPKAEEAISYGIPAYKLDGAVFVYFAGWKQHYSLYPAGGKLVAAFKDELAPYTISKGTIRFPLDVDVPVKLIAGIAKFRAKEASNRAETKPQASKKR